jgi:hypothetical protein
MTADFLAWSHSRLKMFLECPKQVWHNAAAPRNHPDRIEFRQSKAMLDGVEVDNALTARISAGTPLPPKFEPYEPIAQMVMAAPGTKFTQMSLALDKSFRPCGYKDWGNAWVRVIYDLAIINGDHAYIWDWKNGMIWPDDAQLRLFATVGFHQFPEVMTIDTSYIWLKHGQTSDKTYRRREIADLWQTFLPDVERLQVAFKSNHWPASPVKGKATCSRCSVNEAGRCSEAQGPFGG